MIAIWYRLKYWLATKRTVKKIRKEADLQDPYIYEE